MPPFTTFRDGDNISQFFHMVCCQKTSNINFLIMVSKIQKWYLGFWIKIYKGIKLFSGQCIRRYKDFYQLLSLKGKMYISRKYWFSNILTCDILRKVRNFHNFLMTKRSTMYEMKKKRGIFPPFFFFGWIDMEWLMYI